ncbi:MAG: Fur family transcriptional regulator [Nannocystaceae bacterium]|nr:transcriptional repressor [bacterium]
MIKSRGLRVTMPRLAVVRALAAANVPLSYREVHDRIADAAWDPSTTYRNLVKLRDAGIAPVVSRVEGIDRYAIADAREGQHRHPHFLCEDCGLLACLPADAVASTLAHGPWAASLQQATVQLRGTCPACLEG